MSAALDAAATVAIYLAWAVAIVGGVIALAAIASRWQIPKPPARGAGSREERLPDPPATTGTPDWAWPERRPEFDPSAALAAARLRTEYDLGIRVVYGTAADASYDVRDVRPPGSWDPEAFRGSLAERAVEEVWQRIEIEEVKS